MKTIETAYRELLENMTTEKESIKESKNSFKDWIAKNFSITGKDKNDIEELEAVKKLMKAKGFTEVMSVLTKYHVSPEEIEKIKDQWIDMNM